MYIRTPCTVTVGSDSAVLVVSSQLGYVTEALESNESKQKNNLCFCHMPVLVIYRSTAESAVATVTLQHHHASSN